MISRILQKSNFKIQYVVKQFHTKIIFPFDFAIKQVSFIILNIWQTINYFNYKQYTFNYKSIVNSR